ncbi:sodium- and chloride-dependent glycine transporter 2-like [Ptychodera flava]|uniref:sodium- and chloride-dependent glycine transporter 2-like n=1 Tax=Ptychodera flava TaxID=63121 RepID=UPI00396AB039
MAHTYKAEELPSPSDIDNGDENKERGNWTGKLDFILSLIGYAVGMSNIWRFPFLCYRNGGGAFLIPYLLFMALCGMPLFFLEVAFGQFCSEGPITAWKVCRLFKGAGISMTIITGLTIIYYNVNLLYIIYFFIASFTAIPSLPWATCDNWWNTEACSSLHKAVNSSNCTDCTTTAPVGNLSYSLYGAISNSSIPVTPAEEYWNNRVLRISDGLENLGPIQWDLALLLLLAWIIIFLCLCKGVKSSGKVVYFTATFPYLVITILIIRGVTLPGSLDGLKFYFIPRWELLKSTKVWSDAASQIFFSLGPSWGGLLTMASYNKFHHNCLRDSILVPIVNSATSIYCGIAVFSVLGFLAQDTGLPIENVVKAGPGLVFVVYPEALTRIPIGPLWSALFFLMMLTMGLDICYGEGVCSAIVDCFPVLRKRRTLFVLGLCVMCYILGLPMTTPGGNYILFILDWLISYFGLMVIALVECLVFVVIYGVNNFYDDIAMMLGKYPTVWWKICWAAITPLTIIFILIMMFVGNSPIVYGSYLYPEWSLVIGWMIASASVVIIPVWMVVEYFTSSEGSTFGQRWKSLVTPTDDWGPAVEKFRTGRYDQRKLPNALYMEMKLRLPEYDSPHYSI